MKANLYRTLSLVHYSEVLPLLRWEIVLDGLTVAHSEFLDISKLFVCRLEFFGYCLPECIDFLNHFDCLVRFRFEFVQAFCLDSKVYHLR